MQGFQPFGMRKGSGQSPGDVVGNVVAADGDG